MKLLLIYIIISFSISMNTVENLDLENFMGKWYVISNIPNFIEKDHINSHDTYHLNADGSIDISYYGEKNGRKINLKQKAKVIDTTHNSLWQLRFTWPYIPFFRVPFKVIILDDNYEYMVVGYDGSTLGWIMSRNNFMDESLYENIMNELETKFKYDRNQFKKVTHK